MSKTEILEELPKLTAEDRQEIRLRLAELDQDDWLDDGELTDEEKAIIDARLDACERHPGAFIPWEQARARIATGLMK